MQSQAIVLLVLAFVLLSAEALYGPKSDVVQCTDKDFSKEVLKYPGVAIVEFYAPWQVVFA